MARGRWGGTPATPDGATTSAASADLPTEDFDMGRLEKLLVLEAMLKANLDTSDVRSLAGIAKQYRETLKDIEELERAEDVNDDIGDIIRSAAADGADRSEVSTE